MNFALPPADTRDARTQARTVLLAHLADAGYAPIEPPILQHAATFLDFGGEDIRAHLFLTSDGSGVELCLRPEYTIPVCRAYLASPEAGRAATFSYCGPVFRSRQGVGGEITQAGLEDYGRTDTAAADAEVFALTLEAVERAGAPPLRVKTGDAGLVARFLDAVALPPLWQRRLKRGLEKNVGLETILRGAPAKGATSRSGAFGPLAEGSAGETRALVEELLSFAGISAIGGRSVAEIAERFLTQAAGRDAPGFGEERRTLLERFLGVSGSPDEASRTLRALARDAKLDLAEALDLFDSRTGFLAAVGVDPAMLVFSTAFARDLDYYSGFVFEARAVGDGEAPGAHPVAGGGRYDRLATAIGSPQPIPAIGAAIWVEHLGRSAA